ncbi:MAG: hypothetical protein IJ072_07415 [Oscillospiraceae bacterium]|nr:hypothetical protein [Oscillospiraceae bacterium]
MVKLIMGVKGTGKTNQLVDLIHKAASDATGAVVCIENGAKMTYDIPYTVRLVDAAAYGTHCFDYLKGLISGLHAGNYDINEVFVDNLLKIAAGELGPECDDFVQWCAEFSEREKVNFTMTISGDTALASETLKKYL